MEAHTTFDMATVKERLRAMWTAGDFGVIAPVVEESNKEIVDHLRLQPGTKVLDVACGTGNSAIPAAQHGAKVVGVDIAPNLLEQARTRAKAAGVNIRFQEGDAEDLDFPDDSFDVVISIFGAMFAPSPELVAAEFRRVCRPGGRIVMGNWTSTGYVGLHFGINARYAPPPPGMSSPLLWGDEGMVRERLREGISQIEMSRRISILRLPFGEERVVEHFRTYFGPTLRTFEALDPAGREAYRRDLEAMFREFNRATDGTTRIESEYLEVIATRA